MWEEGLDLVKHVNNSTIRRTCTRGFDLLGAHNRRRASWSSNLNGDGNMKSDTYLPTAKDTEPREKSIIQLGILYGWLERRIRLTLQVIH